MRWVRFQSVRILVLGYMVRSGMGGIAWHYLHYIVGLERLGHDVYCSRTAVIATGAATSRPRVHSTLIRAMGSRYRIVLGRLLAEAT